MQEQAGTCGCGGAGLEDELEDDRAKAPQKDAEEVFEDDFEDDDEFRDFIDDDLADGEPAGRARRRRRRVTGLPAGVSAAALRVSCFPVLPPGWFLAGGIKNSRTLWFQPYTRESKRAGPLRGLIQEAQEIFGDVTALLDVYSSRKRPDNDEEEDPPQDDEDEDGGEFYLQQVGADSGKNQTARNDVFLPSGVVLHSKHALPGTHVHRVCPRRNGRGRRL